MRQKSGGRRVWDTMIVLLGDKDNLEMGCGYKREYVCPASIRARSKILLIINPSITATL